MKSGAATGSLPLSDPGIAQRRGIRMWVNLPGFLDRKSHQDHARGFRANACTRKKSSW